MKLDAGGSSTMVQPVPKPKESTRKFRPKVGLLGILAADVFGETALKNRILGENILFSYMTFNQY